MQRENVQGLTVLELLITLAITAILLMIAVPGMTRLVESGKLSSTYNELLHGLYLARSEAVKRGHRVSICPSKDGQSCADRDWEVGWIVFSDPGASLDPDPDDIISISQGKESLGVTGNQPVERYVSYLPSGRSARLSGALQMGSITLCSSSGLGRKLVINASGRPRRADASC
ncbi:MAG: GspH/FimT family pseudopilin [Halothiobacillaceae bacterium]